MAGTPCATKRTSSLEVAAANSPPMSSASLCSLSAVRWCVPLKAACSSRCVVPATSSYLLPAEKCRPTEATAPCASWDTTVSPEGSRVTCAACAAAGAAKAARGVLQQWWEESFERGAWEWGEGEGVAV